MNDNRNYGLDIARIIAMCGIIILHILGQGGILKNIHMDNEKYWNGCRRTIKIKTIKRVSFYI